MRRSGGRHVGAAPRSKITRSFGLVPWVVPGCGAAWRPGNLGVPSALSQADGDDPSGAPEARTPPPARQSKAGSTRQRAEPTRSLPRVELQVTASPRGRCVAPVASKSRSSDVGLGPPCRFGHGRGVLHNRHVAAPFPPQLVSRLVIRRRTHPPVSRRRAPLGYSRCSGGAPSYDR